MVKITDNGILKYATGRHDLQGELLLSNDVKLKIPRVINYRLLEIETRQQILAKDYGVIIYSRDEQDKAITNHTLNIRSVWISQVQIKQVQ